MLALEMLDGVVKEESSLRRYYHSPLTVISKRVLGSALILLPFLLLSLLHHLQPPLQCAHLVPALSRLAASTPRNRQWLTSTAYQMNS